MWTSWFACYCCFAQIVCPPFSSLQQLSMPPLLEPLIGVNFAHFPPYGSGQLNGENRLSGTFGSASLDGISDYYSQLIYKVWLLQPSLPFLYCVDLVNLQKTTFKFSFLLLLLPVWSCSRTILAILQRLPPHCPPHRHLLPSRSCRMVLPLRKNWPGRQKFWVSMKVLVYS